MENVTSAVGGVKKWRVLSPVVGRDGKTYFRQMGIAHQNQDVSINLYLDGLPVNGKLQMRPWDEVPPWERKDAKPGQLALEERPRDGAPF